MSFRIAPAAALLFLLAAAPSVRAQEDKDPFRVHIRMHKKVAPAIVQVRGGSQTGTGVIIRNDGIILTSPTACGIRTGEARVMLPGNRRVTAKVIGRRNDLELVLLKIDEKDLPVLEFADSAKAKIGQVSYAFGDVWESIPMDDQVAMTLGIVSGLYEVTSTNTGSLYTGPVIETSAAVNPNQDGGPLVDAEGKILGIITLNYHPAKFTGIAIPAHILKPAVDRMLKEFADGTIVRDRGYVGIKVEENPGEWTGVRIVEITEGSPADKFGLRVGDTVVRIDQERVTSIDKFEELTQDIRNGSKIRFQVQRNRANLEIVVTAGTRSKPKAEY